MITYTIRNGKFVLCRDGMSYMAISPEQVDELEELITQMRVDMFFDMTEQTMNACGVCKKCNTPLYEQGAAVVPKACAYPEDCHLFSDGPGEEDGPWADGWHERSAGFSNIEDNSDGNTEGKD